MVGFLFKILLKMDQTLSVESDTCYTHNFSFRCDIICPVSGVYFSLLLSTIARHCDDTQLSDNDSGKKFLCCWPADERY